MPSKKKVISVRLNEKVLESVEAYQESKGISASQAVEELVKVALEGVDPRKLKDSISKYRQGAALATEGLRDLEQIVGQVHRGSSH
jgi:hypothetical protein